MIEIFRVKEGSKERRKAEKLTANKKAFTLAEVLITLGIIGVIAAIIIPNLIAKYEKKVLEKRLTKVYSYISQALLLTKYDLGTENLVKTYVQYNGAAGYDRKYEEFRQAYYKRLKKVKAVKYKDDKVSNFQQ